MKWFNKLSVLVRSLARGPGPQRYRGAKTAPGDEPVVPEAVQAEAIAERADDLEEERVADLLQRRFVSSELDSQPGEKGD
ncbi:MAG: hypothetical protein ISS56_11645 [Anaerolineae bacterium]|jgi:hypothetical protein|nr:hypothetical protein [Anaerolineae bacterium]